MRPRRASADPLDRSRFPVDPWRLVECDPDPRDLGVTETLFTVANGYIGMRGNPEEGRDAYEHGTYVNGFHETWPIRHAEAAFGFAETGQTIVNVPDAKLMKLYVDDEPLVIGTADLEHYERTLDFRDGVLRRSLLWRTPSGKRVRVDSTRMVSMTQRHLVRVHPRGHDALGRRPGARSRRSCSTARTARTSTTRRRRAGCRRRTRAGRRAFEGRVLLPKLHLAHEDRMMLGYQCANSRMTVAVAADHSLRTDDPYEVILRDDPDLTKMVYRVDATRGEHHPPREDRWPTTPPAACRCASWPTAATAPSTGPPATTSVTTSTSSAPGTTGSGRAATSRSSRTTPSTMRSSRPSGSTCSAWPRPARGPTSRACPPRASRGRATRATTSGTARSTSRPSSPTRDPSCPATSCTSAAGCCPRPGSGPARSPSAARSSRGARSTARRPRPTTPPAPRRCTSTPTSRTPSCSTSTPPATSASSCATASAILVETARLYADLGFWRNNGERSFHIHGVTGPDEYTTVVNNNLFTNVMARYNLEQAVAWVEWAREQEPEEFARLAQRLALHDDEVLEWAECAEGMHIPFDDGPRDPPAGRLLPRPRGVGPQPHPRGAAAAAPALPPAGHLPLPGAQAGRRRARPLPARRPVHRRGEAQGLRVLRPDHDRRLDALGRRPVGRRGRGGLPRGRLRLLPPGAVRRPGQPARQHRRRAARRLDRWGVGRAGQRVRRHARPRRPAAVRAAPARRLGVAHLPDHLAGHSRAGHAHGIRAAFRGRGGRAAGARRGARDELRRLPRRSGGRGRSTGTVLDAPGRWATGRRPAASAPTAAASRPGSPTRCRPSTPRSPMSWRRRARCSSPWRPAPTDRSQPTSGVRAW